MSAAALLRSSLAAQMRVRHRLGETSNSVIVSRSFARLRLRQRSGDMHMLYMAAFVGIGSGWYIFAPLFSGAAGGENSGETSTASTEGETPRP